MCVGVKCLTRPVRWAVGSGQWAVGSGQWGVGDGRWAVSSEQWTMRSGRWPVGKWQRGVGEGKWAGVKCKGRQVAGHERACASCIMNDMLVIVGCAGFFLVFMVLFRIFPK